MRTRMLLNACTSSLTTRIYTDPKTICRDCKYFRPNKREWTSFTDKLDNGFCTHPTATSVNIVSGVTYFDYADDMRNNDKKCGVNARYFQKGLPLATHVRVMIGDCAFLIALMITFAVLLCFVT